jgi:hypothetical protein
MSINVFSREGLTAWLETQDPETEYDYTNAQDCLIQRYMKDRGVDVPEHGYSVDQMDTWGFNEIANGRDNGGANNYSAALSRAKALLP